MGDEARDKSGWHRVPLAITGHLGLVWKAVGAGAGMWAGRPEADVERCGAQTGAARTGAVGCRVGGCWG